MIKLSDSTFQVIPEGRHVFQIIAVNYKADFGKMEISLATAKGLKHIERYSLTRNGEVNDKAIKAFSYFARQAMDDNTLAEIDENDLVGKYIEATVEHNIQPNKNKPSENVIFLKLSDWAAAKGFKANDKVNIDDF